LVFVVGRVVGEGRIAESKLEKKDAFLKCLLVGGVLQEVARRDEGGREVLTVGGGERVRGGHIYSLRGQTNFARGWAGSLPL